MAHNTCTHPSPKPVHPWAQRLCDTHPQTPFTHGSDTDTHYSHFHPWTPILTDAYPLNHFIPGLRHSLTWIPQLCAGAWGRSRGKGGFLDGVGTRVLGCGPRLRVWIKGKHGGQGRCRNLGKKQGARGHGGARGIGWGQGYGFGIKGWGHG